MQHTEDAAPEQPFEHPEEKTSFFPQKALTSPGAAFGFWLFLTGVVALIDAIRLPPYDLADISLFHIAISCGIFSFELFSQFHRFSLLRLGCALAGGAFVFNLITVPGIADMDWSVPLLAGVALLGLDLFFDTIWGRKRSMPKGHRMPACMRNDFNCGADFFDCATSFGHDTHPVKLPLLTYGRAEVSFGELTIDLTDCQTFSDSSQLTLHSSFGELVVLIPRFCRAEVNIRTAFASCDILGTPDLNPAELIYVNGDAFFGHIAIRYI